MTAATTLDLEKLSRDLIDSGKLIEAGFIGLRIAATAKDAPEIQVHEMRIAFFAGAQHLFGTVMTVLEPDAEPTEKDMEATVTKVQKIAREICRAACNDCVMDTDRDRQL